MADLATLQTRLSEAETALHDLATGSRVVEVRRDGKMMKYGEANKSSLADYIADLRRQIDVLTSADETTLPRRRFIGCSFG